MFLKYFNLNIHLSLTFHCRLVGPNTGQGWINEGRRTIPLMPRGIPQTAYTELADEAAQAAAAENKEILKRLEAEKLIASKTNEDEISEAEGETAESALSANDTADEILYPPVVMEDQSVKVIYNYRQ